MKSTRQSSLSLDSCLSSAASMKEVFLSLSPSLLFSPLPADILKQTIMEAHKSPLYKKCGWQGNMTELKAQGRLSNKLAFFLSAFLFLSFILSFFSFVSLFISHDDKAHPAPWTTDDDDACCGYPTSDFAHLHKNRGACHHYLGMDGVTFFLSHIALFVATSNTRARDGPSCPIRCR